ncbi:dTDP-4-dehydrorhamnose 3,5-epimerase [Desulfobotulus alkaliphilus]|uniref:dTDP-4-dehydrorhamnose 3,5-epimerase n=1 Tax=Desulfobotulus alkaliphilus TaxID=622671 RepID=A0A562RKH4_9BACT|nr:dTDP-4-dehydrorhamnose 3,5-epimerase [Desulfobotulus alkaliphilus]TWI68920.1 dTDP-4-dehydrorhamnose 3,5-epimerase [Desulfobotulus alkaliphilus]
MRFTHLNIRDLILITPKVWGDNRGYFMETFREDLFRKYCWNINFIQENESRSSYGVLRGLHYQLPPFAQSKLIRVVEGTVLDVAVDLREGSPTFGQHAAVELSAENRCQLFIPQGFAHGFLVTSRMAIVQYKVDNYYSAEHDCGVAFDDKDLGIDWKLLPKDIVLSEKDKCQPLFRNAVYFKREDF